MEFRCHVLQRSFRLFALADVAHDSGGEALAVDLHRGQGKLNGEFCSVLVQPRQLQRFADYRTFPGRGEMCHAKLCRLMKAMWRQKLMNIPPTHFLLAVTKHHLGRMIPFGDQANFSVDADGDDGITRRINDLAKNVLAVCQLRFILPLCGDVAEYMQCVKQLALIVARRVAHREKMLCADAYLISATVAAFSFRRILASRQRPIARREDFPVEFAQHFLLGYARFAAISTIGEQHSKLRIVEKRRILNGVEDVAPDFGIHRHAPRLSSVTPPPHLGRFHPDTPSWRLFKRLILDLCGIKARA
jgi:hypothetical protein